VLGSWKPVLVKPLKMAHKADYPYDPPNNYSKSKIINNINQLNKAGSSNNYSMSKIITN
jgi:hypothetical protein